jgi:2-oxo-4-hydroxy-4-carboxy-5-ureidoimidazoline decarboxylase
LSDGLTAFNALPADVALGRLLACFAGHPWAALVAAGRPYADFGELLAAAESAWFDLTESDWLAAFATHPRIGERGGHAPEASDREQSQVHGASEDTLVALAAENRMYEAQFGYVFLIAAAGRGADEILAELRRRIGNEPELELAEAAGELRQIARMRLEQMLRG